MTIADWVKYNMMTKVDGTRQKGRPNIAWWDGVKDMKSFGLS